MHISVTVQVSLDDAKNLMETQKGSDPLRGWLTTEELEEFMKDENRISAAKGS